MIVPDTQKELDGLRRLDPQVIGAVYDRYFPVVFRFVSYRLNDEALAEDVASEVFVRLLESSKKNRGPDSNLKSWLLTTASHIINDHLRRVYRRKTVELSETLTDPNYLPPDTFDLREQNRVVKDALAQLTPEQQDVLSLRFGAGYSLEETATVMQKKVNAVKALQFRAVAALNRKLGEVLHG
ncbi:MAG: sigma-70 family RNA polymerase sigma factor [Chloroflexota bacterium]